MSALIGVRSSCDMLARNSDLSWFARSTSCDCHCSRAFCSREIGRRVADALFELAVQPLERLVQPLVLDLLA